MLYHERTLIVEVRAGRIAGVDEAGRGPLAGPVVAAAVVLPDGFDLGGIADSKKLSPVARERVYARLVAELPHGDWAVGMAEAGEIDRINILQATHEAMRRAVGGLALAPDAVLVDGLPVPRLHAVCRSLVKGDSLSASIAAASIIAKVTRDRLMCLSDEQFPGYGFAHHKGYGSPVHLDALARLGPCPLHRFSFGPVAQCRLEM